MRVLILMSMVMVMAVFQEGDIIAELVRCVRNVYAISGFEVVEFRGTGVGSRAPGALYASSRAIYAPGFLQVFQVNSSEKFGLPTTPARRFTRMERGSVNAAAFRAGIPANAARKSN